MRKITTIMTREMFSKRNYENEIAEELADVRKAAADPPSDAQRHALSVAIAAARIVGASEVEISKAQRLG